MKTDVQIGQAAQLNGIHRRLRTLGFCRQLAFAASCCQRMTGAYARFRKSHDWGSEAPLDVAMKELWECASGQPVHPEKLSCLLSQTERIIPDSEDFSGVDATLAQNEALCVCSALDYTLHASVDSLLRVATYPLDSIDLYIQRVGNLRSSVHPVDEVVASHPLTKAEISRQIRVLDQLEQGDDVSALMQEQVRYRIIPDL